MPDSPQSALCFLEQAEGGRGGVPFSPQVEGAVRSIRAVPITSWQVFLVSAEVYGRFQHNLHGCELRLSYHSHTQRAGCQRNDTLGT